MVNIRSRKHFLTIDMSGSNDDDPAKGSGVTKPRETHDPGKNAGPNDKHCFEAMKDWKKRKACGSELQEEFCDTFAPFALSKAMPLLIRDLRNFLLDNGVNVKPRSVAPAIVSLKELLKDARPNIEGDQSGSSYPDKRREESDARAARDSRKACEREDKFGGKLHEVIKDFEDNADLTTVI